MYRIKLNGNYNVLIKDLSVSISASQNNEIVIDERSLNNSLDIKRLLESNIITIEQIDQVTEAKVQGARRERKTEGDVFIAHDRKFSNPPDTFVREEISESEEIDQGAKVFESVEIIKIPEEIIKIPEDMKIINNDDNHNEERGDSGKRTKTPRSKSKV